MCGMEATVSTAAGRVVGLVQAETLLVLGGVWAFDHERLDRRLKQCAGVRVRALDLGPEQAVRAPDDQALPGARFAGPARKP